MSANYYQVVFDANLDVVQVKDMGPAPSITRTVGVVATSVQDAQKRAKALVGRGDAK